MNYIKYILLFLIVSEVCSSQTIRFNNTYTGDLPGLRNIEIVDDGYIGLGFNYYSGKIQIFILKIDTFGDTLWTKHYGDTIYNYYHGERNSLIKNYDGGYSLAGSRHDATNNACLLVKFDNNFDTLWTKLFFNNPDFTTFYNHVQTSDSGYACIGYTNEFDPDGDILLVKTDAMGNMQWYKNYGTGAKDYGFCIVQTPDKGYLIGGHTKGYGGGDGYLIKTDSLGNEEWTEHYGHPTYPDGSINDIEQTNDGGYVFATDYAIIEIMDPFYYGKYNVIKLDTNYNLLWNKQFGILAEYHGVGSIIEANNGDLVLTVGDYLGNEYKAGLLRLTADGDSIEKKYITPPVGDEEWLFALQQTSDKGFVMAGVVFNPQQMWVVKVDSCGCDTTGCICDYSNILEFSESSDNGLLIYPNPANEKLTIKSCGNILQIEIIDYFGRVIKTISEIKEPEKTIDVSSLPKGLYLVRVYGEGFVETGKIVVN